MNDVIEQNDDIEVELANSWERIGAALLNNIFGMIATIPMVIGVFIAIWQTIDDVKTAKETKVLRHR